MSCGWVVCVLWTCRRRCEFDRTASFLLLLLLASSRGKVKRSWKAQQTFTTHKHTNTHLSRFFTKKIKITTNGRIVVTVNTIFLTMFPGFEESNWNERERVRWRFTWCDLTVKRNDDSLDDDLIERGKRDYAPISRTSTDKSTVCHKE